jgi:hypothetical protein
MMSYRFLYPKAANIFLAGSAILLLASCLPAPAHTNAPSAKPSPYAEHTYAFTLTPGSSPNEESTSTSPPGELPPLVSSTTQTLPAATSTNTRTSDLGWSGHWYGDIAFGYPEHWKQFYIHEYYESSNLWKTEFYIWIKEPDKDIGMFFHYKWDEDDPTNLFTRWAKDGMDISGFSFKPETFVDVGNIMIAGNHSFTLTAQGYGSGRKTILPHFVRGNISLTVQATYLKLKQNDKVMGLIWYAPSDQWDAMREIFSEILASITFVSRYYTRDGSLIYLVKPDDWSLSIRHPDGKGTWFQSADQKIGMLVGMMPQGDPSKLLADWTPRKLTSLGFSHCSVPIPEDRMEAAESKVDTMQGKCLDDSGVEVTYTVGYLKVGNDRVGYDILEVVTYFPTMQSERAWIPSLMFESIHWAGNCNLDPFSPECHPE